MGLSHKKPTVATQEEERPLRVYIFGLYSAGKSTVLHVTKFGKPVQLSPTIGTDYEQIIINNIPIGVIEEGGRSGMRALRRLYYSTTSGFIFVVDSNDRERIDIAREQLHELSNEEELRNKPILIFANKQDLPNSMTVDELRDKLNLAQLNRNIKWHLQLCSAIENEGLHEGFEWLANSMVKKVDLLKPIFETIDDTKTIKNGLMSTLGIIHLKRFFKKFV